MTTGLSVKHGMEHRDGKGKLIYAEYTRDNHRWDKYDTWRSGVCNRNRDKWLWYPFRQGKINLFILFYAFALKLIRR